MNNIIILGNGQLGSFLFKNWRLKNYKVDVIDYPEFDLTNQQMIRDIVDKYDIIINAAAYTLVDKAEDDQLNCYEINSIGPAILATECTKQNKKFVHISTEAVYGSNDPEYVPIKEDAERCPVNIYGKSKKMADDYIENLNNENILILRPGWLFGPDNDHNFIEKIKRLILTKDNIKVVDDQIGTLTYVGLILRSIEAFLKNRLPGGTYNIGNNDFPSRYEVACFVRDQLQVNCKIEKCSSSEFKRTADVAKNSCLDCDKIKRYIEIRNSWREDVEKVLNLKKNIEKSKIKNLVCFYIDVPYPQDAEDEDVYIPMHCGRAVCTTGYSDFLGSMIGDDTGENISILNPYLNEFTGIYWCGKHYEEIGNPEYFGCMHYHRILKYRDKDLSKDTICASYCVLDKPILEQLTERWCSEKLFNELIDIVFNKTRYNRDIFDEFLKETWFYSRNLFIMHRDTFKEYFKFIELCINACKILMENSEQAKEELQTNWRALAMALERMTGYFIYYKIKKDNFKVINCLF